jgi:predicted ATPase
MGAAMVRHDALIEGLAAEYGGQVVRPRGEGDSRFAVFGRATDGVSAACAMQIALVHEAWPLREPLRVRMALHTGEADLRTGDYYGPAVNHCARLRAVAHGGQVLVSSVTTDLVRESLATDISLRDMGEHQLKDLDRPEHVWQLVHPSLPSEFPALGSLTRVRHNLPGQATPFIGRHEAIEAITARLASDGVRLLTITGAGGIGKTRLALQVATDLVDSFADGVFVVPLAAVADASLVAATIAQTLGVREVGARSVAEELKEQLRAKELLLVLDNLEHLLPAAPLVGDLLEACPRLSVLVTSRTVLHLAREHLFEVPPLAIPDPNQAADLKTVGNYESIRLFCERAQAVRADFVLTMKNVGDVANICRQLDGLPLAIELAAARVRLFTPRALLTRLERRLPLLTGGARDLPARQQTLRGAIAWSYDLLDDSERALFRRLALFVGGCTLEAAEAVADPEGELGLDLLDGVTSLLAKSLLLRQEEGPDAEPRLKMLETIREYGLEQLEVSGELESIRQRHAAFLLAFVEAAEPKLLGREQVVWLRRVEVEQDNLRAVLGWSRDRLITEQVGMRLAGALAMFWSFRGFAWEARGWTEAMLALPGAGEWTAARARTLYAAACIAGRQSDAEAVQAFAHESAAIFAAVGDPERAGRALSLKALGELSEGNHVSARSGLEKGAAIAREVGDRWGLAYALNNLGAVAQFFLGDYTAARAFRAESAALARAIGDRYTIGAALAGLALLARLQGNHEESYALFKEALTVSSETEDSFLMPRALAGFAGEVRLATDFVKSARLFGAAESLREASGTREMRRWREVFEADLVALRTAMGEAAFAAAWKEGHAMSTDKAVAYALGTGLTS